jgi:hypothetical protein
MRSTILAGLATVGLGVALAAPARAQWPYQQGYANYPLDVNGSPFLTPYGTRVYGPGGTVNYPYVYRSNNPSFAPGYNGPGYYQGYYGPGYTTTYWRCNCLAPTRSRASAA